MSKVSVCLTMIVKNEAHILPRLFESVRPWIDTYCIHDTGSTDDTVDVIVDALDGIPGTIQETQWIDFAWNRTAAVRDAQALGCDYLLLLDADHVLDVPDPSAFDTLTADGYLIELLDHELRYKMPYLVNARLPWKYMSPTHEYLTCDEPVVLAVHPTLSIVHHSDGGTRPEKLDRDVALLERAYQEDPTSHRTTFYLAQTYEHMGRKDDAIRMYEERIALGEWDEEVYVAMLRIANLTGTTDAYLRAHAFRPTRPEAIAKLAERFNDQKAHHLALAVIDQWSGAPSLDILFVERGIEAYVIDFQKALALFYVGRKRESKELFVDLLNRDLPEQYRSVVENNLKFFT